MMVSMVRAYGSPWYEHTVRHGTRIWRAMVRAYIHTYIHHITSPERLALSLEHVDHDVLVDVDALGQTKGEEWSECPGGHQGVGLFGGGYY